MMSSRAARLILRLYPRAWRARYEDEVLALLDESVLSVRKLLDLASGACVEWVHLLLAPRTSAALLAHRPVMWLFRVSVVVGPLALGVALCRAMATAVLHLTHGESTPVAAFVAVGLVPILLVGALRLQRNGPMSAIVPKQPIGRSELWRWGALFLVGGVAQNISQLQSFSGASGVWPYVREFSMMFGFSCMAFAALVPHVVAPWFGRVTGRNLFPGRPAPNVPPRPLGLVP